MQSCPRFLLALLSTCAAWAQITEGELRISVRDASGRALAAQLEVSSGDRHFRTIRRADTEGKARLLQLSPGVYTIVVSHPGFESSTTTTEIRSAVPRELPVTLQVGAVRTELTIREEAPLVDPSQPSPVMRAGRQQLEDTLSTTLGRSAIDVITTMPGWLLEANAVLHPRGSEYDTQYVVDGMPIYDNRSLAFAPPFETPELESVNVMTGGIPAEFGRRLGGVIAIDTRRNPGPGHNTEITAQAGAYGTYIGSLVHQQSWKNTALLLGVHAGATDRYLDSPSLDNFTNNASGAGLNARLHQDFGDRDRLSLYLRSQESRFLVPNDPLQQTAGQRQDRFSGETAGQVHYQHTFSSRSVGSVRGMVRDLSARLWSNTLATPVWVDADRGFREGAAIGSFTFATERHTLKAGADFRTNRLNERLLLAEPDELPELDLDASQRGRSYEYAAFLQDHIRWGNFAANIGLRVDRYQLLLSDTAISPRVALSYYVPSVDLLLHASYDRIFQPPPVENLLLSSAAANFGLDAVRGGLPVPPSRANFFEAGVSKPFRNRLRLDATHYWRTFRNYSDDDVFLNTGVSFPITFDTARVEGTEVRLSVPRWRSVSAFVSYSNLLGKASSPVTGGLFVRGGEADELRETTARFPITQDQRNTLAAQARFEPHRRLWFLAGMRYGSGLPVELLEDDDDENEEDEDAPIADVILDKVNFDRGRVRPNFSLDLGLGLRVWSMGARFASVRFDVRNATDRLNLINFSGVFSGTAIAPGRQIAIHLKLQL